MFGKTIDYYILRPFTHSRNKFSESELDEKAKNYTYSFNDSIRYLERTQNEYFGGHFPVDPNLSYLDVGCGLGRLSIGLSLAGIKKVIGVDIIDRHIDEAKRIADLLPEGKRPSFYLADIHEWDSKEQFDVIIVLGAMEHIHSPRAFLISLSRLLKPEGRAFVSIEPFQGPIGDHMSDFFRIPILWRGLLFSEQAILQLRRECFRPTDPAERFEDIRGGLNKMWYEEYIKYVSEAGLKFVSHNCNPQLNHKRKYLPLYPFSYLLTKIPKIRGYFIVSDYSILKRKK